MTSISLTSMPKDPLTSMSKDRSAVAFLPAPQHLVIQILSLLLFGGFAIVATVLAFVAYWPAGFALAIILSCYGFGPILNHRHAHQNQAPVDFAPIQPHFDRTGNISFDAYRAEVLKRLEDEQSNFVRFLDRLREAKDESEFDAFMDDRALANREANLLAAGNDTVRSGEY